YARTDRAIRRIVRKSEYRSKNVTIDKKVTIGDVPEVCPKCNVAKLQMRSEGSYVVLDLKFIRKGIRRWVVRYRYSRHRCSECGAEMSTYLGRPQYGPNLRAF